MFHKFDLTNYNYSLVKTTIDWIKLSELTLGTNFAPPGMVCSHCGSMGHNKRTCVRAKVTSQKVTPSEKRVAKALSALLPPHNKTKKVSKTLEDISSCQNIWKEPKDLYTKQKCRENTCATCGGKGHNSRTCLSSPPTVIAPPAYGKKCGTCGEFGHNARTCVLKLPEKKQKKCGICDEFGHNSRTCLMKCQPCSDQVARSYCFAGMTAVQAVKMTKTLECESIYGETEEYPQLVESPKAGPKTECITFTHSETTNLDIGI